MDQQLGVINTAVVFSSTTNKFFKLWSVALEKKKGGAETVVNAAYIFMMMLWSKARTPKLWMLQWEHSDRNNFKSPSPDPFTSFLVYDNNTLSDLPSSYTHKDC